ncbi:hypothetical protein SAMN02745163_04430 [Clostridium cavendishii DSM 21758]|uniref:Uncharacterized protein n=1 Tax=Clostridium cavendishii DSM 21758 TaxID=1121302 RepID=A0A1M6V688_9CLOT|nr:hypothetical protein [Clostridium cavendishii]SHK76999.1 hypothetical protein SAMN02745163_04430 [Clostridium cavendishii DSM 21758]
MKKNKITSLILTLGLVAGLSQVAFAAPNDDVLTALRNSSIPSIYITKAENYLKTITLTADQASAVSTQIDKVKEITTRENTTDLSKLSDTGKQEALAAIQSAAKAVGLTASITQTANGDYNIKLVDANGNEVLNISSNEAIMKKTGNNSYLFILGSVMLGIASSSLFVIKKSL